jgi:flagellar biosynthesis protein FlhG
MFAKKGEHDSVLPASDKMPFGESAAPAVSRTSRVITVSSGKGGVGKTNFAMNLAIHLADRGKKVVILDADFGLANIEVLFGVIPKFSLANVIYGDKNISEVIADGPKGIKFISGGSGFGELANISENQINRLLDNFGYLDQISDVILIDTGAGISKAVVSFVRASDETIIVTTPEPTSITDAYALIKTINEEKSLHIPQFKIVINRVESAVEGVEIFTKLKTVAARFLGVELLMLGSIPIDNALVRAVKKQQPALTIFPTCAFSKSIITIGDKLIDAAETSKKDGGVKLFIKRLVNIFGT